MFKNYYRGWTHEADFCRVFGHHWPKTRRPWERDSITEGEYAIGKWSTPSNQENTQLESGQCPGAKKKTRGAEQYVRDCLHCIIEIKQLSKQHHWMQSVKWETAELDYF